MCTQWCFYDKGPHIPVRLKHILGVMGSTIYVCIGRLHDVPTMTKSLNTAVLRMYSRQVAAQDCIHFLSNKTLESLSLNGSKYEKSFV
jgi:hypothetical protein